MCAYLTPYARVFADGRSFVSFRVFDWDLVSADDFLGQCEVHFADLAPQQQQQGPAQPRWLPLYGFDRGGQKADAGDIQVAVWFEAEGVQQDQQGEQRGEADRGGWLCVAMEEVRAGGLIKAGMVGSWGLVRRAVWGPRLPGWLEGHLLHAWCRSGVGCQVGCRLLMPAYCLGPATEPQTGACAYGVQRAPLR